MRNLLIVFFVVLLLLLITFFPFKTRFMTHFNIINLKGYYCLKIWRIKLLCGMIFIQNGDLQISNSDNILSSNANSLFIKEMAKQILSRLNVKKVEVFFTGGFVDDSYLSAMMCGSVSSIIQSLYSYLSQKYKDVKMYEDIQPTFNQTNLEITMDFVVSVSLFQIFLSILKANKLKKELKEDLNEV